MKKALVLGGCGFVGRRLVHKLLALDYHVTVVDDLSTGRAPDIWPEFQRLTGEQHERFKFIRADVRDVFASGRLTSLAPFNYVFHCAAIVGGRLTIEHEPLQVAADLAIDADLFRWLIDLPVKPDRVIYFSSSAVYPTCFQERLNARSLPEDMVDFMRGHMSVGMPDASYGWSKLSGEYLACIAARQHNIPVVIYRPFSGYGEDQDLSYPFPALIKRVVDGEDPIAVWGSGEQVRDWIHIDDVVDAVFVSMDRLAPGSALNLGSGVPTSFKELITTMGYCAGRKVEVKPFPDAPEGVFYRLADIGRMRQYYQPRIKLETGVASAMGYRKELDRA